MTWNESTNPMVDNRESGNQANEDKNQEQVKWDLGVVGRNPRIAAKEGALGMEIVPWKWTVRIFGGMSIMILIIVKIVLQNQRGRVTVTLHRRRNGSRPDRTWVPELDHGSTRTVIWWHHRWQPTTRRCLNSEIQFYFFVHLFVNLKMVNWGIYLVNNLSPLLSLQISPIWGN